MITMWIYLSIKLIHETGAHLTYPVVKQTSVLKEAPRLKLIKLHLSQYDIIKYSIHGCWKLLHIRLTIPDSQVRKLYEIMYFETKANIFPAGWEIYINHYPSTVKFANYTRTCQPGALCPDRESFQFINIISPHNTRL